MKQVERLFADVIANPDSAAVEDMLLEKQRIELALSLKNARERAGLTQVELSMKCGIAQPEISRFEQGKVSPRLGSLLQLCNALGLRLELSATQPDR